MKNIVLLNHSVNGFELMNLEEKTISLFTLYESKFYLRVFKTRVFKTSF